MPRPVTLFTGQWADLPLEQMAREESFGQLRDELEKLAPADREILTLRYALDYNAGEIAEMLDINPTAVWLCQLRLWLSVVIEGEDLLARCLQHEIDHLDGKFYIDHLTIFQRLKIQREVARRKKSKLF